MLKKHKEKLVEINGKILNIMLLNFDEIKKKLIGCSISKLNRGVMTIKRKLNFGHRTSWYKL